MKKFFNIQQIKKHFKKGLPPLLCALTLFNYCCINAKAYNVNVTVPFIEPAIPDYGGYVNVYGDYGYGNAITTFVIAFYPYLYEAEFEASGYNDVLFRFFSVGVECTDTSFTTYVNINENYPPGYTNVEIGGMVVLYRLAADGDVVVAASQYVDNDHPFLFTRNYNNVVSWQPVGNFSQIYSHLTEYNSMSILWGDDKQQYDLMAVISNRLVTLNNSVNLVSNKIDTTNNTLNQTNVKLDDVIEILEELIQQESNGSIQDVSSSCINSVENKENALVGTNASTSELSVNINPLASSVVWNLVDTVVTSNAKVFTMFISILTIAIIGLILNR